MTVAAPASVDWRERAACAGEDTEEWFPAQPVGSRAIEICRGLCPVRAECLYEELRHETPGNPRFGVWGGLTTGERQRLPALPSSRPAALAMLRDLFTDHDDTLPPTEGTPPTMSTIDTPSARAELVTVSALLRWAEEHQDADVQAQGARAEAALASLRKRHAADQELTAITTEAEQLEKRLAELRAREAELNPAPKKKRATQVRDYDTREVRAWAAENGVECPRVGQLPKRVLDAWRATRAGSQ